MRGMIVVVMVVGLREGLEEEKETWCCLSYNWLWVVMKKYEK
jgi:hypothetical protein